VTFENNDAARIDCRTCGTPLKFVAGEYIHDWPRVAKEARDAAATESGM
jgi:hypothetical protein